MLEKPGSGPDVVVVGAVRDPSPALVELVDQVAPQVEGVVPVLLVLTGPVVVVGAVEGGVREVPVDQGLVRVLLVPGKALRPEDVPIAS